MSQPGDDSARNTRERAAALVERGLQKYGAGDLQGAMSEWEHALAVNPSDLRAREYAEYVREHFDVLAEQLKYQQQEQAAADDYALQEESMPGASSVAGRGESSRATSELFGSPATAVTLSPYHSELDEGWDLDEFTKRAQLIIEEAAVDEQALAGDIGDVQDALGVLGASHGDTGDGGVEPGVVAGEINARDVSGGTDIFADQPSVNVAASPSEGGARALQDVSPAQELAAHEQVTQTGGEVAPPVQTLPATAFAAAGILEAAQDAQDLSAGLSDQLDDDEYQVEISSGENLPLDQLAIPDHESTVRPTHEWPRSPYGADDDRGTQEYMPGVGIDPEFGKASLGSAEFDDVGQTGEHSRDKDLIADFAESNQYPSILTRDDIRARLLADLELSVPDDELPDDRTRRRISTLIDTAELSARAGDFVRALQALELAFEEDLDSAVAQKAIQASHERVISVYRIYVGDLTSVPTLALPMHELSTAQLDHRSVFLLSRIDGTFTFEEVLDIAGMPEIDAYRCLCKLLQQGVLEIR